MNAKPAGSSPARGADATRNAGAREAMLYEKRPGARVQCDLCAHRCEIADGKRGLCRVRENRGGTLYTLVYGRTIAQHVDPIEKKPLFHFHPGTTAYSVATPGCNFRCRWCQNWSISQAGGGRALAAGDEAPPERLVTAARREGCRSIAYTYTEPTIFFEYAYDTMRLARAAGLANVFVTNGYMSPRMLEMAAPVLDAANVDLKAFRDETYRRGAGARLQPVLDSLKAIKRLGIWLEVTTLVIPGVNDGASELRDAAAFVAGELGADTPWHVSAFFPHYDMTDAPPTPLSKLEEAGAIGRAAGLRYVYLGNAAVGEDTVCHRCGGRLIGRDGFRVVENRVRPPNRCPDCGAEAAGVGLAGEAAG